MVLVKFTKLFLFCLKFWLKYSQGAFGAPQSQNGGGQGQGGPPGGGQGGGQSGGQGGGQMGGQGGFGGQASMGFNVGAGGGVGGGAGAGLVPSSQHGANCGRGPRKFRIKL